jgi:hypothetical protein
MPTHIGHEFQRRNARGDLIGLVATGDVTIPDHGAMRGPGESYSDAIIGVARGDGRALLA